MALSLAAVGIALAGCTASPAATTRSPGVTASEPAASTQVTASESAASTPVAASAPPAPEATTTSTAEPLAWRRVDADGPPAREDHTWVLNGDGKVAYVFGGRDGTTAYDDTWAFDLSDGRWTQLSPAVAPQPRFGHEAAWVEGVGMVVFAGQADAQTFFNDLWAYDPAANAWAPLPASGELPTPRYGTCSAIGPDGRLWVSHGFTQDQARFSDTVAYDFGDGTWTVETPAGGERPVERCLHACWWTDDEALTLYAGQTTGVTALDDRWTLGDGTWSRVDGVGPPARNLYARARHGASTLVFGGQALDGGFLSDLWRIEDGAPDAGPVKPAGDPPPGRAGAEMIVDASNGRALLFGGRTADGSLDDLWELTGL